MSNGNDLPAAASFLTDPSQLETVCSKTTSYVESFVAEAGADGAVVAMSGGIDSTVTATLAADAIGGERVLALGLPYHKTEQSDMADARAAAERIGVEFEEIQLRPLLEAFERTIAPAIEPGPESRSRPHQRNHALGNFVARVRMAILYYAANRHSRVVLGTANRSETLLGYFTKYGDGAADCYPIGNLYKTEVRALARSLDVPDRIVEKAPSAGFYAGQTDADELGAPYAVIDRLLERIVEAGYSPESAAAETDVDSSTVQRVLEMYDESAHKRTVPPTPAFPDRKR